MLKYDDNDVNKITFLVSDGSVNTLPTAAFLLAPFYPQIL